jgi:carbon-monoxide dehydrogenase medium subunit
VLGVFRLHQPRTVQEASRLLAEHGPEAAVYAGGTELLPVMKERLVHFPHLIDIKTIPGLGGIAFDPGGRVLRIGAVATHREIERAAVVRERAPLLAELAAKVANFRVRAAGTIGGNLCFAEPHSDPAALLVAWGATLTLVSTRGTREIAAGEFFVGLLATAREHDEVLTEIRVPLPAAGSGVAYERFKTHERPSAAVAAVVRVEEGAIAEARVVVGSVGERPTRVAGAEALLRGERPGGEVFAAAADRVRDEVEPTEDAFESGEYKRHLARTMALRALTRAAGRAGGGEGGSDGG